MYDLHDKMQGPCDATKMRAWFEQGFFPHTTLLSEEAGARTTFRMLRDLWPTDTEKRAFKSASAAPPWTRVGERRNLERERAPVDRDVEEHTWAFGEPPPGIAA